MDDENLWWNKITTMSAEDLDLLPMSFLKKYGTFLNSIRDQHKLENQQISRDRNNRYAEIKDLEKLMTEEEKEAI
jgi:hypothetical protein